MRIARWLFAVGTLSSLLLEGRGAPSYFEAEVAPVFAHHCLECHGSEAKKARLDLSRKNPAFAGGKSGKVIVPGKASESLLWKNVQSGEMPQDRPPLSSKEKDVLRRWIDDGAIWPDDAVVPWVRRDPNNIFLRRLTVPEYVETVRSAVGINVEQDARRLLPPDLRADGFNNTAYNLTVDLPHVEAYAALAQIIVGRMDAAAFTAQHTKCNEITEACMRELIAGMGKWLLRGPLDETEVAAFLRISTAVAKEGGNFKEAVSYVLEAMLQSPRFIYRIEKEEKGQRIGAYELASRMSYILWGGPPDKELMRAADAGELKQRTNIQAQVERMLQDARAIKRSSRFVEEWLNLDRVANLRPARDRFPNWDNQLTADMREETLAFFKDVVWKQKRPLWDLMNAKVTFATPRLAEHYGLKRDDAKDLQVLYRFDEGSGDKVRDVSGASEPIHLKIANSSAVKWSKGQLAVNAPTLITSERPPKRLIDALKKSRAFTLEAWITPGGTQQQNGLARIVTLSSGTSQRNFTLGQEGDKYEVRFRGGGTDGNGQPSLSGANGTAQPRPTHVVYTRDAAGKARLYVNGESKGRDVPGDLSNWDENFSLALANEATKDRPWLGSFDMIAIYSRALTQEEVRSRGQGLSRYDLASVPARGGLLTQGSVLTVGGDDASMVARGLFVLEDILADKVGDPPPCVDTTPVPSKPGLSLRAIAETRLANASCRGCHARFEPLAFGLEKYDGVGAYQEKDEHGNRLREDGEILFPDAKQPVAYKSSAELMDLLAKSPRVRQVITRKLTQFAVGRPLTESDMPALDKIHANAEKEGGTYASTITAIVLSDLVRQNK